jgi:hypothetical protein
MLQFGACTLTLHLLIGAGWDAHTLAPTGGIMPAQANLVCTLVPKAKGVGFNDMTPKLRSLPSRFSAQHNPFSLTSLRLLKC